MDDTAGNAGSRDTDRETTPATGEQAGQQGTADRPRTTAPARLEDALAPFEAFRREVDRLFDEFRPAGWRLPFRRPSLQEAGWPRLEGWPLAPAMDLVEKDDAYVLTAELPGLKESDVDITLANNRLTIRGEKKEEHEERRKEVHVSERRFGAFQRSFPVPGDVDVERISADVRDGVLRVNLPRSAEAKAQHRKIEVKAG